MNAPVRLFFARQPYLGAICIFMLLCFLGLSTSWYLNVFSSPAEQTKVVSVLDYGVTGRFGYEAELSDNLLYGPVTLTELDSSVIHLNIAKQIDGSFSYKFTTDQPVDDVNHQVQITATLENTNNWSKSIPIASRAYTEDFALSFPIEADYYLDLAQAIDDQLGIASSLYDLTITASVNTSASSEHGLIEEVFTHSVRGTLQPTRIAWSSDYKFSETKQGALEDSVTFKTEEQPFSPYRIVAIGLIFIAIVYLSWNYYRSRNMVFSPMLEDARLAKGKYKDAIAIVNSLPDEKQKGIIPRTETSGQVIDVSSLDELVKISVILLKPVLQKIEPDRHIYYVIDGETVYLYISKLLTHHKNQKAPGLEDPPK